MKPVDAASAHKANVKLEEIKAYARGLALSGKDTYLLDLVDQYVQYNRKYLQSVQTTLDSIEYEEDFVD